MNWPNKNTNKSENQFLYILFNWVIFFCDSSSCWCFFCCIVSFCYFSNFIAFRRYFHSLLLQFNFAHYRLDVSIVIWMYRELHNRIEWNIAAKIYLYWNDYFYIIVLLALIRVCIKLIWCIQLSTCSTTTNTITNLS